MLHVLSDLVKTFLDTENDIQKHLETLGLEKSSNSQLLDYSLSDGNLLGFPSIEDERFSEITFDLCEDGPDLTPSSMAYSNNSLTINGNTGNDIEDDVVLGASRRLKQAVERVLKILSNIVDGHRQFDMKDLLKQKENIAFELKEEAHRSDKLTKELMDKEKMLQFVENENKKLLDQMCDYKDVKYEYTKLQKKLAEFEQDRERFMQENRRLETEKSMFNQGLPKLQQSKCLSLVLHPIN